MRIRAHERLKTTAGLSLADDDAVEIRGAFDSTKEHELQELQKCFRRYGVVFRLDRHHLYHKSNPHDVDYEIETVLKCVHELGHHPKVWPNTLKQKKFSIKCETNLVIQRLAYDLRIFYFISN